MGADVGELTSPELVAWEPWIPLSKTRLAAFQLGGKPTCACTRTHACTCVCVCILYNFIYIVIYLYVFVCVSVICWSIFRSMYMAVRVHAWPTYIYAYTNMCIYIYIECIYIYMVGPPPCTYRFWRFLVAENCPLRFGCFTSFAKTKATHCNQGR